MVSKTLLSIAALASVGFANRTIKPCFSGLCDKCTDDVYEVTKGVPDVDEHDPFKADGFVKTTNLTGGFDVWWDVTHPGKGCSMLIYEASGASNGTAWGNVILETKTAGCFFANMGSAKWATQFCCGDGDCGKVQPGDKVYTAQDDEPADNTLPEPSKSSALPSSIATPASSGVSAPNVPPTGFPATLKRHARLRQTTQQRRASNTAEPICDKAELTKWFDCLDEEWTPSPPSCQTTTSDPYDSRGEQQKVSSTIDCNIGTNCGITRTDTVTVTESMSTDHSITTTTSNGISVSINAGFSFGQKGGTGFSIGGDVGYSHEWSKAIADSTGFTNATASAVALAYTVSPPNGVTGFLSFTPYLKCTNKHVVCDGAEMDFERCEPVLTDEQDKRADGEYMWVTVGQ